MLKQVLEHRESTIRQYDLRQRAIALGWDERSIDVIDDDLGESGTSAEWREGFQRLAEDVAHGLGAAVRLMAADAGPGRPSEASDLRDAHPFLEGSVEGGAIGVVAEGAEGGRGGRRHAPPYPSTWTPLDGVNASRWTAGVQASRGGP
jgi:hypothetical protein